MNKELASRALGKSGFLVPEKERQTNRERPSLGGWAPTATSPRAPSLALLSPKGNRQSRKRQEVVGGKCKGGEGDGHGIGLIGRQ